MTIEIKHKITGAVLKTVESESGDLSRADLRGANLHGADLSGANLYGADLSRADLRGADLSGADLSEADLRGANLGEANLREVDLYGADLSGANLRGADLSEANLYGEKLKAPPAFIENLTWHVMVTGEYLTVGCQRHSHENWRVFSDGEISEMHEDAPIFWADHKEIILALCALQALKRETR